MQNMQNRDSMSNLLDALNRKAWQLREQEDQIQKDLQQALLENTEDSIQGDQGAPKNSLPKMPTSHELVQRILKTRMTFAGRIPCFYKNGCINTG